MGLGSLLTALVAMAIAAGVAAADTPATAFAYATTWQTVINGHPSDGWEQPGFDDTSWSDDRAPFGNGGPGNFCGFPAEHTAFPENGTVYARKTFTLPVGATSLHLDGSIDNAADVYVNGHAVGSFGGGSCAQGSIQVDVPDGYVKQDGRNVVAVVARDFGSLSFFDLRGTYHLQSATAFGFATRWRALVDDNPSGGWEQAGFDDAAWGDDQAPFGNGGPGNDCGFPAANTGFPEGSSVYARKTFTLPAGATSLHLDGTIDNAADVYVNGTYEGSYFGGSCDKGTIQVDVPDGDLNPDGSNVVAVVATDFGSLSFFDLRGTYHVPPPTVTVPADQTLEATGPSGAVDTFTASASSALDGSLPADCTPASGSTFPLGTSAVRCTAIDSVGNGGSATFNVTVRDTTEPAVTVPGDIAVDATSSAGAPVTFAASARDAVSGAPSVACRSDDGAPVASGDVLRIGTTTVTCSASDDAGNAGTASFKVLVRSPDQAASNLQAVLTSFAAPGGSTSAISDKINQLIAAMPTGGGSTASACQTLTPLNNQIRARTGPQPGKTLTGAQSDRLLAITKDIAGSLGC